MHKKEIKGNTYYYTTFRKGNEHKTVYLGTDERFAKLKEEAMKVPGESRLPFRLNKVIFFVLILFLCGLTFFFFKHNVTGSYFDRPYVGWVTGNVARDIADFTVGDDLVKVVMKERETFKRVIRVSNTGSKYLVFDVNSNIGSLLKISESKFVLPISNTKDVELLFYAPPNVEPGVYVGKIMFNSETLQDSAYTIVEIESLNVLYDGSLSIPNQFRNIRVGDDLVFNIRLLNFANAPADIMIFYEVKDFNGDKVFETSESVHLESEVSFTKTVKLPSKIKEGNYVLISKVVTSDSVGTSAALFDITDEHKESPAFALGMNEFMMIFIMVLLTLIVIVVITTLLEYRRFRHAEVAPHPVRYKSQPVVMAKKPSPLATLVSAFAKRIKQKPKIKREVIIKPKIIFKEKPKIKREVIIKPKVIFKEKKPSGVSLFFKALAKKIKEKPKIKREVVIKYKEAKPKVIIKYKEPSRTSLFFKSLKERRRVVPEIKHEKIKVPKPAKLPKVKEHEIVAEPRHKKAPVKPSRFKSFFSKFHSKKHDAVVSEKLETVPSLEPFIHKVKSVKVPYTEPTAPELEFPHLPRKHLVTKQELLKEGEKLAKLAKEFKPKVKHIKPEMPKKEKTYISKSEKDLLREQELLKKKLEGLY